MNEMQHAVGFLMEMTCRSEEEVCSALHDCDNDMAKACEMLLEQADHSQVVYFLQCENSTLSMCSKLVFWVS